MKRFKRENFSGSWTLGTFFEIPVKIHWTFAFLLLLLLISSYQNAFSLTQTVGFILFFLFVFLCVVLHEYGHALMAKKFNIRTQDIILSPIGGVARLKSMPNNPVQELLIAIAGPIVNVIIALILILFLKIGWDIGTPELDSFNFDKPLHFIKYLAFVNLALFFFNLVPAFPMDGGRILRAILSMRMDKVKATKIASGIGRIFAIGFIILGIFFQHLTLSLIGIFIFMMAGLEYKNLKISSALKDTIAEKIMRSKFTLLNIGDSYQKVLTLYYRHGEKNFLIEDNDNKVIGSIPELFIKDVIKKENQDLLVSDLMSDKFGMIPGETSLEITMDKMKQNGWAIVGIQIDGDLVGVLDRRAIEDFIILQNS